MADIILLTDLIDGLLSLIGVKIKVNNLLQMLGFDFKKVSQLKRFQEEFQHLGIIGSGGFAEVIKVRNLCDGQIYAAKIIKIKPSLGRDDNEDKLLRFLAQPKAHAYLSHPNILQYHGSWVQLQPYSEQQKAEMIEQQQQLQPQFEMILLNQSYSSDGIVFGSNSSGQVKPQPVQQLQMKKQKSKKLGDGSSFSDYKEIRVFILTQLCEINLLTFLHRRSEKQKEGQLSTKQLLQIYKMGLDMINGLSYLHKNRMIHRDIKLQNVMIGLDGRCRIIDFGLAKRVKYWKTSIEDQHYLSQTLDEYDEKFSSSIGTKLFSSPEQASSEKYDYRTDIYSLAVVLVLLFNSYTTAHQQREILQKIRKRNLEEMMIPQALKLLVFKCLGGENERASLSQLKKCIKDLMRQIIQKQGSQFEDKESFTNLHKQIGSLKDTELIIVKQS